LSDVLHWVGQQRDYEGKSYPYLEVQLSVATLVLVTTAELWVFRPGIDLEAIERADSLDAIAERVPAAEFVTTGSAELRAHCREWCKAIARTRPSSGPERPERQKAWEAVTKAVTQSSPNILIVQYEALEAQLQIQAEAIRAKVDELAKEFARRHGFRCEVRGGERVIGGVTQGEEGADALQE
jgi:hypothetical protein